MKISFSDELQVIIPAPDFGEILNRESMGENCHIIRMEQVSDDDFDHYAGSFPSQGFTKAAQYSLGPSHFYIFTKDALAVFLTYFPETQQLRIVCEEDTMYLRFLTPSGIADFSCDEGTPCQPMLTQIDLEDFGLSYLIRLADGRFVVIDGGWDFECEADKLMTALRKQSPTQTPRIAAWIFTHPHEDHYPCFSTFCEKYSGDVKIEALLYSFPPMAGETLENFPRLNNERELERLRLFEDWISKIGAPVIRPHTGQVYKFGDVQLEILSSPDDLCRYPADVNALSLITRLTVCGQSILFCADGLLDEVLLSQRYGAYLKSDILQVTHHGFNGGSEECYRLVDPSVCLVPSNERTYLRYMAYFNSYNRALIYDMNVQDFLIGGQPQVHLYAQQTADPNIVLTLPYTPRPNGRQLIMDRAHELQKQMGANSWYFGDMTWDSCKFSILNPVYPTATICANLYFGERTKMIRRIKITVTGYSVKKIDFANPDDIDGDAFIHNTQSLTNKGIPTDETFSVHFLCDTPIVIWSDKEPVYVY